MFGDEVGTDTRSVLKEKYLLLAELLCSKSYGVLSTAEPLPTIQELNWLSIFHASVPKKSPQYPHIFGIGVSPTPELAKLNALYEGIERIVVFSPPPREISCTKTWHKMQDSGDLYIRPPMWFHDLAEPLPEILWYQSLPSPWGAAPTWHPYSFQKNDRPQYFSERHSSGFACHENLSLALRHCRQELLERDHFLEHWWLKKPFIKIDKSSLPKDLHQDLKFYLGDLYRHIEFYCTSHQTTDPGPGSIFTRWRYHGMHRPAFLIGGACRPCPGAALWSGLLEVLTNLNSLLIQENVNTQKPFVDFTQGIKFPADRIYFYQQQSHAQITDFYFENCEIISWQDLNTTTQPPREREDVCFDLTPIFGKPVGCRVARVIDPGLIPMDGTHSQRAWWHTKIATASADIAIQTYPHPYP